MAEETITDDGETPEARTSRTFVRRDLPRLAAILIVLAAVVGVSIVNSASSDTTRETAGSPTAAQDTADGAASNAVAVDGPSVGTPSPQQQPEKPAAAPPSPVPAPAAKVKTAPAAKQKVAPRAPSTTTVPPAERDVLIDLDDLVDTTEDEPRRRHSSDERRTLHDFDR